MRYLNLILGDQLDLCSSLLDDFDPDHDRLWMAEVNGENTHVRHHKHQIVMFLSAMRLFAQTQRDLGREILYTALTEDGRQDRGRDLKDVLAADLRESRPNKVRVVLPGDRRVLDDLQQACDEQDTPLEVLDDRHFFTTPDQFREHSKGRKTLRMEFFYRELRVRHKILVDAQDQPEGGQWNYDAQNRGSFSKSGPPAINAPRRFTPCTVVKEVSRLVDTRYGAEHPGNTENFALPVRRAQALQLLNEFIVERLPNFGDYQDALWEGEFFLYHSRISTALNLKLLSPKEVCERAEQAYREGSAPLNAVEGFIRQVLGWREYIRGVYWTTNTAYRDSNSLNHTAKLPDFFWTGKTDMACLQDVLRGVRENAYSHHIQRLMITGLFVLLLGVRPGDFNDWHLATHCDAIDWVSTPNVIGMSQFADGGLLASKPYCASGNYINKMSNHCKGCRYNPKKSLGEDACPFTVLYWDFLERHQESLKGNARLKFQFANLQRKSGDERRQIAEAAKAIKRLALLSKL